MWQLNNYLTRIDNLLVEREDRLVAQVPPTPEREDRLVAQVPPTPEREDRLVAQVPPTPAGHEAWVVLCGRGGRPALLSVRNGFGARLQSEPE